MYSVFPPPERGFSLTSPSLPKDTLSRIQVSMPCMELFKKQSQESCSQIFVVAHVVYVFS